MLPLCDFKTALADCFRKNSLPFAEAAEGELGDKFHTLATMLEEANSAFNLTAIKDPHEVIAKHIADSLLAAAAIPEGAKVLDVGCGGGFPCLPLAIARPDLTLVGLDSTAKKLRFVDSVAERLSLRLTTLNMRAEDAGKDEKYRASFDIVTARAVARLNILAELCLPLTKKGGAFVAMKAAATPDEIAEAAGAIAKLGGKITQNDTNTLVCPDGESLRSIIIVQKTSPTPTLYPRNYSQINKKPLA